MALLPGGSEDTHVKPPQWAVLPSSLWSHISPQLSPAFETQFKVAPSGLCTAA